MKNTIILGDNLYELSIDAIKEIDISSTKENLIVVPDRFSLLAELLLFDVKKISCTFNTFVTPISKFCTNRLGEIMCLDMINSQEQKFLIRRAINLCKDKFKCFKKISPSFIDEISKTISQLKSCKVKSSDLNFNSSSQLANKLHDFNLIFEKYDELLEGRIDNNELLNVFLSKLDQIDLGKYNFYFTGFNSLTTQTCQIIKAIMKKFGNVCLCIPFTKNKSRFFDLDMYNMFKKEIESGEVEVKFAEPSLNQNQRLLSKNFIGEDSSVGENYFSVIECENVKAEIDFVLMDICDKLKRGYKFNDIAIACSSLEKYEPIMENRLNDFEINYFFDSSKSIVKTPLHNFVLSFLNVFKNKFKREDVFDCIQSQFYGLLMPQKMQIVSIFDKYQIFEDCFKDNRNFLSDQEIEITAPTFEFFDKYENKIKSCKLVYDFSQTVKEMLEELNCGQHLEELCGHLKEAGDFKNEKIFQQIYKVTVETLNSVEKILGSEICDLNDFVEIYCDAFADVVVSTVPISNNCVYIGDCTDSFFKQVKCLYVLGATNNALPRIVKDCGLLLDDDLDLLNQSLNISPTIKVINKRNRFKLANTLLCAKEKLIVTYPIFEEENSQNVCSLISDICANSNLKIKNLNEVLFVPNKTDAESHILYCCPNKRLLKEKLFLEAKNNRLNKLQLSSIYQAVRSEITNEEYKKFNFKNDKPKLKNAKQVYFEQGFTKVSQLEDYFLCPYRHFLNYGLKLKDQHCGVSAIEIGNLLHKIAQIFAKNIKKIKDLQHCDDFVNEIFNAKSLNEFFPFSLSKQNDMLLTYIKYESKNLVRSVFAQQQSSLFSIEEIESKVFVAKYFNDELGLKGFVDRIDVCENQFIIVDYKSSNVNFNVSSIYCGEKIQVLVYAGVIEYLKNKKAVGTFYLPVKKDDNTTYHKFVGYFVKDEKLALKLDTSLNFDKPASEFFNLKISKSKKNVENGEIVLSNTISATNNLQSMIDYSKKLCENAIKEIESGYIACSPLKNACSFCGFGAMCDFNTNAGNKYRTINFELKDFFGEGTNE